MTKAIKKVEKNTSVMNKYSTEQIEVIKTHVAKGASDTELAYFLTVCQQTNLDPFSRQIYFVKRGGEMTIQTGIDGYRAIAEQSNALAGIEDAVYDTEEAKNPNKATVTVKRKVGIDIVEFTASARWSEYFPGEKLGFMWKKMPYLMLGKVAESLALRKAFPTNLSGIRVSEEMDQADNIEAEAEIRSGNAEKLKNVKSKKIKMINQKQKNELLFLLEKKGRTEKAMLEHYKIKEIEEMDEEQFIALSASLNAVPDFVEAKYEDPTVEEKENLVEVESEGAKKMRTGSGGRI